MAERGQFGVRQREERLIRRRIQPLDSVCHEGCLSVGQIPYFRWLAVKPKMRLHRREALARGRGIPWGRAANTDGSFKSADELRAIYEKEQGLKPDDDVIAYCRIGERSSHTWFVLTHLLGYEKVRNYDGSWTEWGNAVKAPIEKGGPK